ncbi:MAG TPA: hypothetical protein VFV65_03380 [Gemmatimonadales bacterium]|nr:hypothetical protein [Gemmatimonadales bacterium]
MSIRACILVPAAFAALACARDQPAAVPVGGGPQEVEIIATEYGYQLPSTPVHAGLTTITLVNAGHELHHMQLVRLADGKTVADLTDALMAQAPLPAWVVYQGGPNGARPGERANATLVLEPGQYAMYCRIPSPDGKQHMAKGMVLGMSVEPGPGAPAALPTGDIQVRLFDYGFSISSVPRAGPQTFAVSNDAAQPHELVIVPLAPGETMQPWVDWVSGQFRGPPPGMPFAGITDILPGASQNFAAVFAPGTYGLICFVRDATDGKSHVLHGMTSTFTVS